MRAKTIKLGEGKLSTHCFLAAYDVDVLVSHIIDELAASAIMAKTADVPEEDSHLDLHWGAA